MPIFVHLSDPKVVKSPQLLTPMCGAAAHMLQSSCKKGKVRDAPWGGRQLSAISQRASLHRSDICPPRGYPVRPRWVLELLLDLADGWSFLPGCLGGYVPQLSLGIVEQSVVAMSWIASAC